MHHTAHETYQGWDITVQCTHTGGVHGAPLRYKAQAEAELRPNESPDDWIDPRLQQLCTGGRGFPSGDACIKQLMAEAKKLIDALRK